MARALDLNGVQTSFMDLTLQDDDRTIVHLDIPTEAMINELQHMNLDPQKLKTGDADAAKKIYEFAAKLISCNFDFFTVTGDELLRKYRMNLFSALEFFKSYMAFIEDLGNEKN